MAKWKHLRKKRCGIYKITEISSARSYIGQSLDIGSRWCDHLGAASSDIGSSLMAHPTSFRFQILEICPKEKLNEREKYYIEFYDSLHPNGFNHTKGGGKNHEALLSGKEVDKSK